ncbi:hypothetical protein E4T56_gene3616 [Termitomyces sp. T112]|nr:hypothetical protein E4T56_gene3616 [Termitomyces sp. T112]
MNTSQPLLYDLNRKPMRLAGTTMLSSLPSVVPCLNGSRTFFALHSSKPPTTGTSLTLCLNWDNPTNSRLVPFDVSPSSKNSETTINHPWTPSQLHSRSAQLFVINVRLNGSSKVFSALINSSTSSTFISNQLSLQYNDLDKPFELQLFDGSPAMTRITQYHDNTLTLNNDLQFQAQLLITQLPLPTPIMLRLPWLQDINSDIDWKNLTMQFLGSKASLVAAIPLCL